jgi:PAS fold
VRRATGEDPPYALEYRIVRADGTVAWVLERGQLVLEADGETRLHGVIFDITERKRAEEILRRREAQEARIAEQEAARHGVTRRRRLLHRPPIVAIHTSLNQADGGGGNRPASEVIRGKGVTDPIIRLDC